MFVLLRLFSQGANFLEFPKWAHNLEIFILDCCCFISLDCGIEIFGILGMSVRRLCLDHFSKKWFEAHFPDPSSPLAAKCFPLLLQLLTLKSCMSWMAMPPCKQIVNMVSLLFANKQLNYYRRPDAPAHMVTINVRFYADGTHPVLAHAKVSHLRFWVG